ncbi:hypothetical protein JCM10908_003352 [Rhodotorula pacifica]|uniref:uncharacterized protein n=1 Tax=Rhodotorula pacifica TaxID=1495444 RepID=UPI0031777B31
MPTAVTVEQTTVDAEFDVRFTCDFEAKLWDLPEGETRLPISSSVPLKGDWYFKVTPDAEKEGTIRAAMCHDSLPYATHKMEVTVALQLYWRGSTQTELIKEYVCDAQPCPDRNDDDDDQTFNGFSMSFAHEQWRKKKKLKKTAKIRYRLVFTLTRKRDIVDAEGSECTFTDPAQAQKIAKLHLAPIVNLRLAFPQGGDQHLGLWTTTSFLSQTSEYYKDLLASGCAETVPRRAKRLRNGEISGAAAAQESSQAAGAAAQAEDADAEKAFAEWQDSDDEADNFLLDRNPQISGDASQELDDIDYRQIEIRETAYSTFRAVLLYLQMKTGEICFAPLNSSLAPRNATSQATRQSLLDEALIRYPDLPLPVSPKSVYRLAHLIGHAELQKAALDSFASHLTIDGAPYELFSPVAIAYDELRKVVVDYVVKNWKEIKVTESWKIWRGMAARGEIEGAAQVLVDLLGAIHDD